jgi:hypothetical protein
MLSMDILREDIEAEKLLRALLKSQKSLAIPSQFHRLYRLPNQVVRDDYPVKQNLP